MYTPHRWKIIFVESDEGSYYKVLAGWYGGYIEGDSWKINSGITSIDEQPKYYDVHGYSGSVYRLSKEWEGFTGLSASIYQQLKEMPGVYIETRSITDAINHLKETT
jgi:hypothetical protein